tara:strand:- start:5767 stop:7200 length:1434 start_codon:yes stop_codon:yes gene_type:complete
MFILSYSISFANELSVQEQLDIQKKIIEEQNKRIDQLETLIRSLKNSEENKVSNDDNIIERQVSETSSNKKDDEDQGDIAASTKSKIYNPEKAFFGPLPQLRSKDGKYSAGFMGLVQLDTAVYDHEPNNSTATELASGFIVRRAVLTLAGVSEKDWIWFLSYNYANGGENPNDGLGAAMAIYRGFKPWWLFVGLFGNSVGLDASNMSSQRQFMEVAMPQGAFIFGAGSPAMGVAATYRGKEHYMRVGFYGEPFNNASTDDEGMGVHGRLIWQPHKERLKAFHLGVTGYHRLANVSDTFTNGLRDSTLRFRSKGETAVSGDYIVDSGVITDLESYNYVGYEFAMVEGPLSLQSEWGTVSVNRKTQNDPRFTGGYIQGGYMITDDARNYNAYFAQFWRLKPTQSIMEGGLGAWELALRASNIDLNDTVIKGGEASSYTLGINWYMTAFTKAMFNIIKTESSGKISEDFDSINGRLQIEF